MFCGVCAADGALRIDISVHERDLENMAKGKRLLFPQALEEIKEKEIKPMVLIISNYSRFSCNSGAHSSGLAD